MLEQIMLIYPLFYLNLENVSKNALSYGKANLKKYHITNVKLVLSNGLKNISDKYDTLTICGMGTHTIIDILKSGY